MLAVGCAINPVTGNRELALVSESQEIEMGRQGSADVIAAYGLVPDAALQTYVNRIGQTLAAKTERPQLAWEFHVVDDAAVNAFALPGGYIFVTRGLLTHMTNEAELASVLGHEAGHVAARHSVQQISRQQIASLGLGLGSVLSPVIAKYGQVVGAGLGLLFLKYSRDDETQADQLGFRYALADGYDTREMIAVFQMLQDDAQLSGGGRLPEWQSTHPDPGNRIVDVQGMVAVSAQNFSAMKVGGDEFLKRIDGMVYGENPRAGYFKGSLFIHPDLKFVLEFPDGWQTLNAADAVTGISSAQDALIQLRGAQGTRRRSGAGFLRPGGVAGRCPVTSHDPRESSVHRRVHRADRRGRSSTRTRDLHRVRWRHLGHRGVCRRRTIHLLPPRCSSGPWTASIASRIRWRWRCSRCTCASTMRPAP